MITLGAMIRQLREKKEWPQRKLANELDVDVAVLSRIENDNKFPNKRISQIIETISKIFEIPESELKRIYLSDKIASILLHEEGFEDILRASENKVLYGRTKIELQ